MHSHQTLFGAIDLGTNSCRLLIARFDGRMHIIDSYAKVVRLGEHVMDTHMLSHDAINRSVKALEACMKKIAYHNVPTMRAVTTQACRVAKNADTLIARVQEELNLKLEIISPKEEAHLALSGCSGVFHYNIPYAITFDIGGGSTEVMWAALSQEHRTFEILDWISLPFGVVTLSDAYGSHATSPLIYNEVKKRVMSALEPFIARNHIARCIQDQKVQMVGTSGTITTIAALYLKLLRYDRSLIDGIYVRPAEICAVTQSILHMPHKQRYAHPCMGAGRSDLIVTGSSILEGILSAFCVPWLRVADRGVREGILMQLIQKHDNKT